MLRKAESKSIVPRSEEYPPPRPAEQQKPCANVERWVLNGSVVVSRSFDVDPPRANWSLPRQMAAYPADDVDAVELDFKRL